MAFVLSSGIRQRLAVRRPCRQAASGLTALGLALPLPGVEGHSAEAKTIETVLGLDGYEFTVGYGAEYGSEQVQRLESAGIETRRSPVALAHV